MHNPSWNLFLDNVYTYAYCKNLFTKEECEQIIKIYHDTNTLKEVSKNGLHTVNNLYNLEIFSSELKNIIKI